MGSGNRDCFLRLGAFQVCSTTSYLSIFSNLFLLMAQAMISRVLVPGRSNYVNASVSRRHSKSTHECAISHAADFEITGRRYNAAPATERQHERWRRGLRESGQGHHHHEARTPRVRRRQAICGEWRRELLLACRQGHISVHDGDAAHGVARLIKGARFGLYALRSRCNND